MFDKILCGQTKIFAPYLKIAHLATACTLMYHYRLSTKSEYHSAV